jgi:hypothetical protein
MSNGVVINVRTNFPEVVAKLNQVSDQISSRVMVRALNATITQGKTEMARDISKEFRIKVGEAKNRLDITPASSKGGVYKFEASLQATKKGKGRSMNVIAFVTSVPKRNKKGKLSQVKFQIRRSGGKKSITGAFVANKGRTLFIREGKARLPIKAVSTIDIPQMFNTQRINDVVQRVMLDKFEANIDRQLRVVLEGFAK